MKVIQAKGKIIELYDSIDEMPIINFQKYNKFLILDMGIGSDINSIDSHLVKLAKLIKTDLSKAQQELQNLRQNLHMAVTLTSPKFMSFAALIHSINGKEVTDLSDDNLKKIIDDIKEIPHYAVTDFLIWVKKKLQRN